MTVSLRCISFYSYIKPQPLVLLCENDTCCISFYSYIKPQLRDTYHINVDCCISFYSYIKPQREYGTTTYRPVVYRSIPTSNRNLTTCILALILLYIVLFLHQTATRTLGMLAEPQLYIVLFLHQTATSRGTSHQASGCISFYSYIKPQRSLHRPENR